MTFKEAYQAIVDLTGGNCYCRDGLAEDPPEIGLNGRFTADQLREIAAILEQIE